MSYETLIARFEEIKKTNIFFRDYKPLENRVKEVEDILPELYISQDIKNLWLDYFNWRKNDRNPNIITKRNS